MSSVIVRSRTIHQLFDWSVGERRLFSKHKLSTCHSVFNFYHSNHSSRVPIKKSTFGHSGKSLFTKCNSIKCENQVRQVFSSSNGNCDQVGASHHGVVSKHFALSTDKCDNRRHVLLEQELANGFGDHRPRRIIQLLGGKMTQPFTVCVEGNIGSGKTTFLQHFKSNPEVCVFDEPISKWRDCQGFNLLDLMYKDPKKWSLCFQSYVQLTMLDLHTKPVVQPIKMMERSIFSAQYCFVKNLRDEGVMEEAQYTVLSEWFNFSTTNLPIKLDLIVYLRTDPDVAYKRITQRGRSEENSIKLEYLQSVHELHENWLVRKQKMLPCPVLTIDANLELEDMAPNYLLCEERLFQKSAVANC